MPTIEISLILFGILLTGNDQSRGMRHAGPSSPAPFCRPIFAALSLPKTPDHEDLAAGAE